MAGSISSYPHLGFGIEGKCENVLGKEAGRLRAGRGTETAGSGVALCMLTVDVEKEGHVEKGWVKGLRVDEHHRNKSSASVAGCMTFTETCPVGWMASSELGYVEDAVLDRGGGVRVPAPAGKSAEALLSRSRSHLDGMFQPNEPEMVRGKKRTGFQLEASSVIEDADKRSCEERKREAELVKHLEDKQVREGERLSLDALKQQILTRKRDKEIELYNLKATQQQLKNRGDKCISSFIFHPRDPEPNSKNVLNKVSAYREALCNQIHTKKQQKLQSEAEEKALDAAQALEKQIYLVKDLRQKKLDGISRKIRMKIGLDQQLSDKESAWRAT